jgi:hypothetical protein
VVIHLTRIKSVLGFAAILLLALAFPMQVYANSPYPSLLPYVVLALIVILRLLFPRSVANRPGPGFTATRVLVRVYVLLVLAMTVAQTVFRVITPNAAMNAVAIYLLPPVFYWYYRRTASAREVRAVFAGIIVASLVVGAYFVYDSYLKLALDRVTDYSEKAFQYTLDRSSYSAEEANNARINTGSRSQGLLQSQAVSGSWIALGAFAALALMPRNRKTVRRAVVFLFGIMLVLGLNFTSICAFAMIMFLFEFDGLRGLRGHFLILTRNVVPLTIIVAVLAATTMWFAGERMLSFISQALRFQVSYAFGIGESANISALGVVTETASAYAGHVSNYPFVLLFGDGFSTFGLLKGGDVGFIETLATFGLPFWLAAMYGLCRLIASGLRVLRRAGRRHTNPWEQFEQRGAIEFAVCVTLLVLITEGHYGVWTAKSILPVMFFALALYERYLPPPAVRQIP